VCVCLLAYIEL